MLLEQREVSRKTQLDGKLEISPATANRLAAFGTALGVVAAGKRASARVEAMTCTCAKRSGEPHVHHFLESPILKSLTGGAHVRLELEQATATLHVHLET
jgi:hypothetical protein